MKENMVWWCRACDDLVKDYLCMNIDAHVEGEQFHESKQSRSILTDPEVHIKMEMEIPRSSGVNSQPHAHT
ncbi:hypothetical protein Tco_0816414 [Tanacetum coccineum]